MVKRYIVGFDPTDAQQLTLDVLEAIVWLSSDTWWELAPGAFAFHTYHRHATVVDRIDTAVRVARVSLLGPLGESERIQYWNATIDEQRDMANYLSRVS